jgi:hypothetical protein
MATQVTLNSGSVDSAGSLALKTNGTTTAVTIDTSQNVGIGTPTPGDKLSVVGSMLVTSRGTGFAFKTPDWRVYNTSGGALAFNNYSADLLTLDSSGNVLVTSAASLGYGTGSGGSVTQATSKGTGVTINKASGRITMNNAALGAGGTANFLVSNSLVASTDTVVINVNDGIRGEQYNVYVWYLITGGFYVALRNISGTSYSDAVVLNFAVIKATTS